MRDEALSYNGPVQSWPKVTRLEREGDNTAKKQQTMYEQE